MLETQYNHYDSLLKNEQRRYIQEHPDLYSSAFVAVNYISSQQDKTLAETERIFNQLKPKVQKSYFGNKLNKMLQTMRSTSVGAMAPDFSLPDSSGKQISLASFKGKITLLDFWASWCGPCRQENPNVVTMYHKYHSKGLEILGVSLDTKKEPWQKAIAADQLNWTQVTDMNGWDSPTAALFGVQSIPSNFLLNKEGKIVGKDLRGADLDQALETLFKTP